MNFASARTLISARSIDAPPPARGLLARCALALLLASFTVPTQPGVAQEIRRALPVGPVRPAPVAEPVFTGPPVKLRIANFTGRGLELAWMNPNGTYENRGMLPPTEVGGAPAVIDTFGGHLWLFKSEGRVLQVFTAGNRPVQDVQVGLPPVAAPPRGSKATAPDLKVANGLIVPNQIPVARMVAPPPPSAPLPEEVEDAPEIAHEFLIVHNAERARLGIAPLRWSGKLARYAQKWAKHLASTGEFEHRDRSEVRYGENLYRSIEDRTPGDAARKWLEERELYRGGSVPREDLVLVGHYTQMIWQETTHVGFGVARGRKGVVIVANYSPGGNRSHEVPYKKPR